MTIDDCTSQADIDAAFAAWKASVVYGGGCDPQLTVSNEVAPDECTGGSVVVTFTVTDKCETTSCTATFSVDPVDPLTLTCPADRTIDDCTSQADIDAAFAAWKASVVYGGGCDPQLTVSNETAPDECTGGSVVVTFTVTDKCETTSCTATFSVDPVDPLTLTCPSDMTIDDCTSQADIDAAFAAWKASVVYGGGCDPQLTVSNEVAPDECTGGSVVVTFTVTDKCETTSCTATFSVDPVDSIDINMSSRQNNRRLYKSSR